MKIQVSYINAEEKEAAAIAAAIKKLIPSADPKYRENHPPRKHIYIAIPEPKGKP